MGMKCRLVAPESGTGTQFELNPTSTLLVCTSKSHPRWLSGQVNSKVLPSTMPTVMLVLVGGYDLSILWSTLVGLTTGVVIGNTTEYFTSDEYKPVRETAKVSGSGAAITTGTGGYTCPCSGDDQYYSPDPGSS